MENSTDHFCEDTRQHALAALTNLDHVTPFLLHGNPASFDDTTKYEVSVLSRSIDIEGVPKYPYLLTKFALPMRGIT